MQISVVGLWHLGSVTAACLADKGFTVIGYDSEDRIIENFNAGRLPIFEPGLEDMVYKNINNGNLSFSSNPASIKDSDLIWVTIDTPVDEKDKADIGFVMNEIEILFPHIKSGAAVLISSQLPVGSVALLENAYAKVFPNNDVSFTCSPENLRLGKAIDVFMNPDRIITGIRREEDKNKLIPVLHQISENIIWMKVESAEMTKHALNAFLATSVVFINELAVLCEHVGANAKEVERGLKSEMRIGEKAYLRPGSAFAGGTLARDVTYLVKKEEEHGLSSVFFSGIIQSNESHKHWVRLKLSSIFKSLKNKKIGLLGLTYKPGTNTLRRSTAIDICYWLNEKQAVVSAYDPEVKSLPEELSKFVTLENSIQDVLFKNEAVIVATEWPKFKELASFDLSMIGKEFYILDENAFLKNELDKEGINYISIGQSL